MQEKHKTSLFWFIAIPIKLFYLNMRRYSMSLNRSPEMHKLD